MDGSDLASILVVDDNTLVLESTCSLLSSHGFSAVACAQSTLAAQSLLEHDFDAVLSDIKMPEMTGLELLDVMRAADPDMPVVLMTAFAELDLALDAMRRGHSILC
jgi:DNA-binding NtrC family response regulator